MRRTDLPLCHEPARADSGRVAPEDANRGAAFATPRLSSRLCPPRSRLRQHANQSSTVHDRVRRAFATLVATLATSVAIPAAIVVVLAVALPVTQVAIPIAVIATIPVPMREMTVVVTSIRAALHVLLVGMTMTAIVAADVIPTTVTAMVSGLAQLGPCITQHAIPSPVEAAFESVALAVEMIGEMPGTAGRRDRREEVVASVEPLALAIEGTIVGARIAQLRTGLADPRAAAVAGARFGGEGQAEDHRHGGDGPTKGTRSVISINGHRFVLPLVTAAQRERSGSRDRAGAGVFRSGGDVDDLLQGRWDHPAARRKTGPGRRVAYETRRSGSPREDPADAVSARVYEAFRSVQERVRSARGRSRACRCGRRSRRNSTMRGPAPRRAPPSARRRSSAARGRRTRVRRSAG